MERTAGPGTRVTQLLTIELARAKAAGELAENRARRPAQLTAELADVARDFGTAAIATLSPAEALSGLRVWIAILGAISAEVFEQFGPSTFADPALLFEALIDATLAEVFR